MKRLVYILVISICLLPSLTKGLECSNEDRTRLQKLADNVTYTLEEYQKDGKMYFKTIFSGVSEDIMIYSNQKFKYYLYTNYDGNYFGDLDADILNTGVTSSFYVYGSSQNCGIMKLRSITINTPSFNPYYNDPVCKGFNNLSICQKWAKVELGYEDFAARVNKYKEQNKEVISTNPNVKDDNDEFDFFDIYNKYYWPTFIGMICLLILLIVLWIKQNKKNRL